jgi:hypothetical protein
MPDRRKSGSPATIAATLLTIAASGALLTTGTVAAHGLTRSPASRAVRALKATDTAHLRYIRSSGSLLLDEGTAAGTLPGRMRASVNIGATISGTFTIYVRGGTITGHGAATPQGSGVYESFAGALSVTGGSGRYARAHGSARLYGTFDRDSYALAVQTAGMLYY